MISKRRRARDPRPLSELENEELAVRAKSDRAALSLIVTRNTPFVVSQARRYVKGCRRLELEDLVVAGQEGILHAVAKFDPDHGVKFLSYAAWWIRAAIDREVSELDLLVHIPYRVQLAQRQIFHGTFRGSADLRRLAAEAGPARAPLSLDASTLESGVPLCEFVAGSAPGADVEAAKTSRARAIRAAIAAIPMSVRERAVLEHRLMGEATLEDLGKMFSLTRERMRQIELKLVARLRASLAELAD